MFAHAVDQEGRRGRGLASQQAGVLLEQMGSRLELVQVFVRSFAPKRGDGVSLNGLQIQQGEFREVNLTASWRIFAQGFTFFMSFRKSPSNLCVLPAMAS